MKDLKIKKFIQFSLTAALILITCQGFAWSASFTITPIFDNSTISGSLPALNNKGQIAYVGSKESNSDRGDVYLYDGNKVTNLTAQLGLSASSPVINDQGQIAFEASSPAGYDVYFYDGSALTNITANLNVDAGAPSLNDLGQIAFHTYDAPANHWDIYLYDGTKLTNITAKLDQSAYSPIINNKGQIVFRSLAHEGRYAIYFYNGASLNKITDAANIFIHSGNYDSLSLNDLGQVAFLGATPINDSNLYLYDGSTLRNLSAELNIPAGIPKLNDKGEIAFVYYSSSSGLWNLYFYDGATTKNVAIPPMGFFSTSNFALNNRSQIAFIGVEQNYPRPRIYLYDRTILIRTIDTKIDDPYGSATWDIRGFQLNDNNQIAFPLAYYVGASSNIYFYDGTFITNLTAKLIFSGSLSLNDRGQIVFDGYTDKNKQVDVFLFDGKSVLNITEKIEGLSTRPSLNEAGQIAFEVTDELRKNFDIYLYDGQNITNITADLIVSCTSARLNDHGQIAFVGEDKGAGISDIYFYDGSTIQNITANLHTSVSSPDLNNRGEIAFVGGNSIYLYDGRTISNITAGQNLNYVATPSLNNKGQIAFMGDGSIYLYDKENGAKVIVRSDGRFTMYDNPHLNDLGHIAFFTQPLRAGFHSTLSFFDNNIGSLASIFFPKGIDINNRDQTAFVDISKNVLYLVNKVVNAPVAQAGPDQVVSSATKVMLDGSGSYDLDGEPLNYRWLMVSRPVGSKAILSDPTASKPTFLADVKGIYEVQLMVDDGRDRSEGDSVLITVVDPTDPRPLAYAGTDRVITTGETITLDGSASYNPKGEDLSYNWSLVTRPPDSQATLTDPTSRNPSLKTDKDGLYKINLIVRNSQGQSEPDTGNIFALGRDMKLMVKTNKSEYQASNKLELFVWAGNEASSKAVIADAFTGFGFSDGRLYFFDSALNLKPADPTDPRSFIPFAHNVTLSSGFVFPTSAEMNADSDDNGKLDSYRIFSMTLPANLPPGSYFAFAALVKAGSSQEGNPQIIGRVSLSQFIFSP